MYAISNTPRFEGRALLAIAAAFSDGPLIGMLGRALGRAVRTEMRWLLRGRYLPRHE